MSKQTDAYVSFFLKNEEGQKFLKVIQDIIDSEHEQAEKDGEKARDHTQTAKGARLVQQHIQSVVGGSKK
jgi:hypothetical protein